MHWPDKKLCNLTAPPKMQWWQFVGRWVGWLVGGFWLVGRHKKAKANPSGIRVVVSVKCFSKVRAVMMDPNILRTFFRANDKWNAEENVCYKNRKFVCVVYCWCVSGGRLQQYSYMLILMLFRAITCFILVAVYFSSWKLNI